MPIASYKYVMLKVTIVVQFQKNKKNTGRYVLDIYKVCIWCTYDLDKSIEVNPGWMLQISTCTCIQVYHTNCIFLY